MGSKRHFYTNFHSNVKEFLEAEWMKNIYCYISHFVFSLFSTPAKHKVSGSNKKASLLELDIFGNYGV